MGDAGIDGDDEIEALHECGRVREVFELGGPIDDVGFVELSLVVGPSAWSTVLRRANRRAGDLSEG